MKKLLIFTLCILLFSLSGCFHSGEGSGTVEPAISIYEPVIMSRTDFENSVTLEASKIILETGKIYVKGAYLFINEPNEGFHVFNNSNPSNPIKEAFLNAVGATDMAIKNNVMYINTATDLIALETNSTYTTINITKRVENIFPRMISPDGFDYPELLESEVIINWRLKD